MVELVWYKRKGEVLSVEWLIFPSWPLVQEAKKQAAVFPITSLSLAGPRSRGLLLRGHPSAVNLLSQATAEAECCFSSPPLVRLGVEMALSTKVFSGEGRSENHNSLEEGFGKEVLVKEGSG